jgi:hypothetical protein
MSHTPTISQPPEPLTAPTTRSQAPPAPVEGSSVGFDQTIRRLQAEMGATPDRQRQSRLLSQIADLHERAGDEPAAARDYLAAFNADPTFREPLEGLVRLLEKRRSLKNLGKVVGALVRAAATPDEKVRALLMRAAYGARCSCWITLGCSRARAPCPGPSRWCSRRAGSSRRPRGPRRRCSNRSRRTTRARAPRKNGLARS